MMRFRVYAADPADPSGSYAPDSPEIETDDLDNARQFARVLRARGQASIIDAVQPDGGQATIETTMP
jgi:hypothetical protein